MNVSKEDILQWIRLLGCSPVIEMTEYTELHHKIDQALTDLFTENQRLAGEVDSLRKEVDWLKTDIEGTDKEKDRLAARCGTLERAAQQVVNETIGDMAPSLGSVEALRECLEAEGGYD